MQISISLSSRLIFITADSLLSTFSAVADRVPVEDQPGYTGVLQRELEGLLGSSSLPRVSRSIRLNTSSAVVSTAVPNGMKLQ